MISNSSKKQKIMSNLIVTVFLIVIMALMIILAIFTPNVKKSENGQKIYSPEIARAMTYEQVKPGQESTQSPCVKFDAFFLRDLDGNGDAESIRGTCREIGQEDTLYMELKVEQEGKLQNGVITIEGENFYFQTATPKDNEIKENAVGINVKEIQLNEIESGTQKTLTGIIRSGDYRYNSTKMDAIGKNIENFGKVNSVTLKGQYVKDGEEPVDINKKVTFNVDWHGEAKTEIIDIDTNKTDGIEIDEEKNEVHLKFDIKTMETEGKLLLKKSYIEGEVLDLNGYQPTNIEVKGNNVTYTHEAGTGKFTAQKEAKLDDKKNITKGAYDYYSGGTKNRISEYNLIVTYPLEAYKITEDFSTQIRVPIKAYYECYNNTASEFENPYTTNRDSDVVVVNFTKTHGTVASMWISVGNYIYEPYRGYVVSKKNPLKIYNEISYKEDNDTYLVTWEAATGSNVKNLKFILKDNPDDEKQEKADQFIDSDAQDESMEKFTKHIGISFANATQLLGTEGWIKVYDANSNELLGIFDKNNWNQYSKNNPYYYKVPVQNIRIETSETKENGSLFVYNTKKLDDEYITNNFTKQEFDSFKYIKSTLYGKLGDQSIGEGSVTNQARYENPYSVASVSTNKTVLSTQKTERNIDIKIYAQGDETVNQEKWKNGAYLLKMPEEIVDVEIESVTPSNRSIQIVNYETYEEEKIQYIKILTENQKAESYTITVNCNITPDPRILTQTGTIELYASNEDAVEYYYHEADKYDVNGNLNKAEEVNHTQTSISLISPNSLLTNETVSNYGKEDEITIAPKVAEVTKEQRTADINIEINNNYSNSISRIKILGRIPSIDNSYVISGGKLGSEFDTTISETGIRLPEDLEEHATVYYSTNINATQEMTEDNDWKEVPTSFEEVKSFLIDLGDYSLPAKEKKQITYEVNIPGELNYGQTTYSHHAVYFSLNTEEGRYKTSVEPNKVGIMITKKYDLEIIKNQQGKEKLIPGATYLISEEGKEYGKTRVTNDEGKLTLEDLYIGKKYTVKEIKSPIGYELNEDEVLELSKIITSS